MDSEDFCDRMEVKEFRQGLQELWGDKEFADVEIVVSGYACNVYCMYIYGRIPVPY